MLEVFVTKRFSSKTAKQIVQANEILEDYEKQGYQLTLRQLYYQFVAKGFLPNTVKNYKNLGDVINNARLAGLIDWRHIEDRTRNLMGLPSWDDPSELIYENVNRFHKDHWENQKHYIEVWVEKEALAGVVARGANSYDLPYFSCRGYVSQSEMYQASKRFINSGNRKCIVIHLGDHDPSGIDMTRDIQDRLKMFCVPHGVTVEVKRVGLSIEQVRKFKPPPNPAKTSDSRFKKYKKKYGLKSWELDALEPKYIEALIEKSVKPLINKKKWAKIESEIAKGKEILRDAASYSETLE